MEIPLCRTGVENFQLQKGIRLETGGSNFEAGAMKRVPEEDTGGPMVGAVDGSAPGERIAGPPDAVMTGLDHEQRMAFERLWDKIPQHLQATSFDLKRSCGHPRILTVSVTCYAAWETGPHNTLRIWEQRCSQLHEDVHSVRCSPAVAYPPGFNAET